MKQVVTESLNEYLRPLRQRRKELEKNLDYVRDVLRQGTAAAREEAIQTLNEVREVMNMTI